MKEDFEEITMYKCRYCEKVFYTNKRHKCKFNPLNKTCFSCTFCKGVTEEGVIECDQGNEISLEELSRQYHWKLDCHKWECMNGYIGKDSYIKRIYDNWRMEKIVEEENESDFFE
ncbi:MAG: hypothetical protein K6G30_11865 [Acetatifactor sp.]|nr:hypothetical protein [Acetatifactor sp.]